MQTFCEGTFEFRTLVDPIATSEFKAIPDSPKLRIVPGRPVRAICIAPSQVRADQGFTYYLKLEDRWGNPTGKPIKMQHSGFPSAGVQTVIAKDKKTGLSSRSNPIEVVSGKVHLHPYWADLQVNLKRLSVPTQLRTISLLRVIMACWTSAHTRAMILR